jgi:hypothetical protein
MELTDGAFELIVEDDDDNESLVRLYNYKTVKLTVLLI